MFRYREFVYAVYQEQSFSKAAQKLFISQPSLSAAVKKAEEAVGVPLFDRTVKPVRLTEAGQQYIEAVRQFHQVTGNFESYLQAVGRLETGSLGIGSNQLLSSLVLPRYVTDFINQYPGIQLSLVDANSTTLQNKILMGELDLVIDNTRPSEKLYEKKRLTTEHLLLAVPASRPENRAARDYRLCYEDILAGKHKKAPPVPLELFEDIPFILMNRDNDTRSQTNAIMQEARFSPRVLMEMDRLMTLYAYVELGAAASVVSDTLIRNVPANNTLFYPLAGRHTKRGIYVSYKKNKYCSAAMRTFIDSLGDLQSMETGGNMTDSLPK